MTCLIDKAGLINIYPNKEANMRTRPIILLPLLTVLFLTGCVNHRELVSLPETELPADYVEEIVNAMELEIQPEDLLRIDVHSLSEKGAEPFNMESGNQNPMMGGGMMQGGGGMNNLELFMGYFVDQNGYIDFPTIGPVEVGGLTLLQAKEKLYELIRPRLKDAVINIRFLNLKINVLGEVNLPGAIRLTNKRVTILEAIGMAGDLTDYANRTNVLVLREKDGRRTVGRLNLQDRGILQSPYFYLQQNDVVYVEPTQSKIATVADPVQRVISYTSAGLSFISLIIALTSRR